ALPHLLDERRAGPYIVRGLARGGLDDRHEAVHRGLGLRDRLLDALEALHRAVNRALGSIERLMHTRLDQSDLGVHGLACRLYLMLVLTFSLIHRRFSLIVATVCRGTTWTLTICLRPRYTKMAPRRSNPPPPIPSH